MKILVTGGAGFIGSHIVDKYIIQGHDVVVVDNFSTGFKENLNPKAKCYEADFCSIDFLKIIEQETPDIINHQAGQTLIHVAVKNPVLDAKININGIINLLNGCVENKVKKIIFASSAGVYGQARTMPILEDTPFMPENPYAITKATSEYYIKYFCKEYNIDFTILRYGNVFGPRDTVASDHVITVFTDALLNGTQPVIHWDGEQKKDFVFVEDVASANLCAIDNGNNYVFNIANGIPKTINDIYEKVCQELNIFIKPNYTPKRKGDVKEAYFNIECAIKHLKWMPKINFDIGIKETLDWYKSRYKAN
jgi:UDP-glucose 4-epimerase